jgi:hypothetical protein
MACTVPEDQAEPAAGEAGRVRVLCEHCDRDVPVASALITFMAVHSPVPAERAEELAMYLRAWLDSPRPRPDQAALDADWEAFRQGAFDDDSTTG